MYGLCAVIHSALASKQMKDLAAQRLGVRNRNGLYRFAYIVQAALYASWLFWWLLHLPDRELYRVRAPWSWLMRAGQAASLLVGFSGVQVIGIPDFNGLPQLQALLNSEEPARETEAQGPPRDAEGRMVMSGAFGFSRHPGNLAPICVFLLNPRMTVNGATLSALTVVYCVLGSLHEEYRHQASYPDAYEEYRRKVPFLIPCPRGASEIAG